MKEKKVDPEVDPEETQFLLTMAARAGLPELTTKLFKQVNPARAISAAPSSATNLGIAFWEKGLEHCLENRNNPRALVGFGVCKQTSEDPVMLALRRGKVYLDKLNPSGVANMGIRRTIQREMRKNEEALKELEG